MDAGTVSIQPGGPLIGMKLSRQEASQRFADGLRAVLPRAVTRNIVIAIEPEPGLLIESAHEYAHFKREFFRDDPSVRMNCDVGHLFCVDENPAAVIREMAGEIAHVHLEDIGANRVHQHLVPGKGAIDFRAIDRALEDICYAGWVTVELYPYENNAANVARAAMAHLRSLGIVAHENRAHAD